jgi:hypothetical protein
MMGRVSGVVDDRGKFIYVTANELQNVGLVCVIFR